jgi:hypothetical protein
MDSGPGSISVQSPSLLGIFGNPCFNSTPTGVEPSELFVIDEGLEFTLGSHQQVCIEASFMLRSVCPRASPFTQTATRCRSELGRGFLLQNLRSYSVMLLDPERPPPFISHLVLREDDSLVARAPQLPCAESLAICKTIITMHCTRTNLNKAFVTRTLAMEQRRLKDEV